jgi:hypothetical protein
MSTSFDNWKRRQNLKAWYIGLVQDLDMIGFSFSIPLGRTSLY